jgi:aldose 1-epimerase
MVTVITSPFGSLSSGEHVTKFTLTNKNDFSNSVLTYGATLQSIFLTDKLKNRLNVALGFDTIEEYESELNDFYFGSIVGRITGRVRNAEFELDGKLIQLEKNYNNHNIHSGSTGIAKV